MMAKPMKTLELHYPTIHVTCLDQSRASKNISWIRSSVIFHLLQVPGAQVSSCFHYKTMIFKQMTYARSPELCAE